MSMPPIALGGGRYELAGLLGRGGMAEVRLARDVRLGRSVAIKRLRADLASDPTFQARFRREAQSAASLNHPSIVAVYDTGEEQSADGSGLMLPYIVMEHVEGKTLRDVLREDGRILPERALEITGTVLDALDYSHRAGIIHRDIKPANVMLTPNSEVKVMDFGIARAIADVSATMTQTAAVVGTAQYLSPEQARGEKVDARSDLYSTGCLLFELLTGRPPFVGDSSVAVAYQHVREDAPAPSSLDPQISPAIDAITLKALTKPVDDRYQSASEMRADIDRALEGRSVLAPVVLPVASANTEPFLAPPRELEPAGATEQVTYAEKSPHGSRTGWWALALLLLVAAILAALVLIPNLSGEDPIAQANVPDLNNLTVPQATKALEREGLLLGEPETANSSSYAVNHIMRQNPAPGADVGEGSAVDVVVSAGMKTAIVPDVTLGSLREATAQLEDKFVVNAIEDPDGTERMGQVTRTDPVANEEVALGSTVDVYYAPGFPEVPNVVGKTLAEATAELEARDFKPVPSYVESDAPRDQVIAQQPTGGRTRAPGWTVVVYVSLGPPATVSATQITPTQTTPTQTTPTETTAPTTSASTETTPTQTTPTQTTPTQTTPTETTAPTTSASTETTPTQTTPPTKPTPTQRPPTDPTETPSGR